MTNEAAKKDIDLSTVKDDLPLSAVWQPTLSDIWSAMNIVTAITGLFVAGMLIFAGVILTLVVPTDSPQRWFVILFFIALLAFIGSAIFLKAAKGMRALLRASAFAQANGFSVVKGLKEPGYPGFIFSLGDTRKALSIVQGNYRQHEFKMFNYSYMEGSGKNRQEYKKGVIMVKLPRMVPNVVFDSKSNNRFGINSLAGYFKGSQKFTFEGDFNNHFDVYAPENYGRDVLYFMTPELMALLVDEAGNYDIEVVDDNLFFYAPELDYKTTQLGSIFKLIQNVGGEFADNTERYADERVGNKALNTIAEPGRRLKRGFSWLTIVAVIIYLIIRVIAEIADSQ